MPITTSLRTGTGRAELQINLSNKGVPTKGQLVVGSGSQLRRYLEEADLLSGRFLIRGPLAIHVRGIHLNMDGPGQARIDLSSPRSRRIAVLSGSLRIALSSKIQEVRSGQQLALDSGKLAPYTEHDPWYAAEYRGEGTATVEATRGAVRLSVRSGNARNALIGDELQPGSTLNTDVNAWAEIGFTGGGYLRLCEQSEMSVVSVERTSQGRVVLLKLNKGTAWNVVEKGQGGYRIDTPVVSTAVRGTVFRVDAEGLVKVFDGQVDLPSAGDQAVNVGQQSNAGGRVQTLQLDDLDRFNIALDAERARPLTLSLNPGPLNQAELALGARSLPDARLSATIVSKEAGKPFTPQKVALSGADGAFKLGQLQNTLPEGRYQVQVQALRYGKTLTQIRTVTIDRTAPALTNLQLTRQGHLLKLSGVALDPGSFNPAGARLTLTVQAGQTYTRRVAPGQPFQWLIPNLNTTQTTPLTFTVRDAAGNETHAQVP